LSTELQPHQQRVVDEKRDLDEKIVALTAFIYGNDLHAAIEVFEQDLLDQQLEIMQGYSATLAARIAIFKAAA
jgi:uncharacterized protein